MCLRMGKESIADDTNVDQLVEGARAHHPHIVLLWFGTWKNGNMHYVPAWVENDSGHFPHVIRADGEPVDVLSDNTPGMLSRPIELPSFDQWTLSTIMANVTSYSSF